MACSMVKQAGGLSKVVVLVLGRGDVWLGGVRSMEYGGKGVVKEGGAYEGAGGEAGDGKCVLPDHGDGGGAAKNRCFFDMELLWR